jgi:ABC-2 type transport system ATP-binding protein
VEELCDRILLINQGKDMLNGRLADIQRKFSGQAVVVHALGSLPQLSGVRAMTPYDHGMKLELDEHTRPQEILKCLAEQDVAIDRFEVALPSLDEIFIQVVQGGHSQ